MKGADIDQARQATISDFNARLYSAKTELKTASECRYQYQSELLEQRQQEYYMRRAFQTEEMNMRQQLQQYVQRLHHRDSTLKRDADATQKQLRDQRRYIQDQRAELVLGPTAARRQHSGQ